jgi:hypothetical protein
MINWQSGSPAEDGCSFRDNCSEAVVSFLILKEIKLRSDKILKILLTVFSGFHQSKQLGGISVSVDSHLWMADTQNVKAIDQWIGQIDAMKALKPEQVIRLILQNNLVSSISGFC